MFKNALKPALAAGIAPVLALAAFSTPAQAQASGVGITDIAVAVASTSSLQTGFQQIGTTFGPQITQLEQLDTQRQNLLKTLDTNGDGQVDENEQAAISQDNPTVQQIAQLEQQINTAQQPIQFARIYVVSQVAQQYTAAVQQVVSDKGLNLVLSPEAVVYAPDSANITQAVAQALNTRVPTVQVTPPQDWQPTQAGVQLYQQVQQIFAIARQQQAQQQQAAPAGEVPSR